MMSAVKTATKDPIQTIISQGVKQQWNIFADLDWAAAIDIEKIAGSDYRPLIEDFAPFKKLSPNQQEELRLHEIIYHTCNLLAGEYYGIHICATIMSHCYQRQKNDWAFAVSTILNDERNHYLALHRYLDEKLHIIYPPHSLLNNLLQSLVQESRFEIQLFVSQVILEWTAASLLSSLVVRNQEPLFAGIVGRILKDEGRHLAFSRIVSQQTDTKQKEKIKKDMEDTVYEGIRACIAALIATPVWKEYGFKTKDCVEHAFSHMHKKGVFHFYKNVLPLQLKNYGLLSERLRTLIEDDLIPSLLQVNFQSSNIEVPYVAR
jgi:hypothetical protein